MQLKIIWRKKIENKHVGWLIIGIGVVMAIVIFLFNNLLKDNLDLTCTHGSTCQMYSGLAVQTWISFAVVAVIIIIGIVIMLTKPTERIVVKTKTRTIKEKKKEIDLSKLDAREKDLVKLLQEENGAIFQAELMERLEVGKVGMTRLLDKLESKEIIERKRRGMNNIVVLKG
jgi:uncharacterized membrane protein